MFKFLKNWFGRDQQELKQDLSEESSVPAIEDKNKEAAPVSTATATEKTVHTELSLHPVWEETLDTEKKYTLRFLQEELPEMIENTVGVTGFSLIPEEEGLTVALFFRNGSSKPVAFEKITLTLLLDDKVFARQEFDMSILESIPAYSSRPWEVFFPETSFKSENLAFARWKVLIHVGKRLYSWPKTLDLDPEMEKRLTQTQRAKLEYLTENLPLIKKEVVEISAFDISMMKDGGLFIGVLFRNGKAHPYTPEKLKIKVSEGTGDIIASGIIETKGKVEVKPNTTRPWMVVFPANLLKKANPDLSDWKFEISE